jgi:hypothetical protein
MGENLLEKVSSRFLPNLCILFLGHSDGQKINWKKDSAKINWKNPFPS